MSLAQLLRWFIASMECASCPSDQLHHIITGPFLWLIPNLIPQLATLFRGSQPYSAARNLIPRALHQFGRYTNWHRSVTGSSSSQGRSSSNRRNSLVMTPSSERLADRVSDSSAPPDASGEQPPPFTRRRSARHRNYLNRSHLHQAVQIACELPDGYGK